MMDSFDKFMAGLLTLLAVVVGGLALLGLITALVAAPIITSVVLAVGWVASVKVYPRIARFIEEEL
jgi:hypothetical protein